MPFMPDPSDSSCQLYTTQLGDSLHRMSALARVGVKSILKDNWSALIRQPPSLKPALKIRLCNMPHVPSGEAADILLQQRLLGRRAAVRGAERGLIA
jgi:hypothetical protein